MKKIAIIVPTKSLLIQTYKMVKSAKLSKKIILHDEMFSGENNFIAVLTQERGLRILEKGATFDVMYIDEAHNLFNKDSRNILLTRLIKKCRKLNSSLKIIYLSPIIEIVII